MQGGSDIFLRGRDGCGARLLWRGCAPAAAAAGRWAPRQTTRPRELRLPLPSFPVAVARPAPTWVPAGSGRP